MIQENDYQWMDMYEETLNETGEMRRTEAMNYLRKHGVEVSSALIKRTCSRGIFDCRKDAYGFYHIKVSSLDYYIDTMKNYMRVTDVAKWLGVTRQMIGHYIRQGLPKRIVNNRYYISKEAFVEWYRNLPDRARSKHEYPGIWER